MNKKRFITDRQKTATFKSQMNAERLPTSPDFSTNDGFLSPDVNLKNKTQTFKQMKFIILFFILLLAAVLRFWQLGKVPISPDWDEVALGYNTYSILHTGRDEYGQFLPIVLRSFDDYKPALYSYLAIPPIAVLGLNVFAVRLPSAFFGVLTIAVVYFVLRELFKDTKSRFGTAEIATLLLAISPWHIHFSRIAFESNVGLFFNVSSVLFFLKGLKKPYLLTLSTIFAGLSIYVYQSEKVFIPLLFIILVLTYKKELFSLPKKYIISSFVVGFLIVLPMTFYTFGNKDALARAKGVSIFTQGPQNLYGNTQRLLQDGKNHDILGSMLDNRRIVFTKEIISGYLSHFDLNWLFIRGDIARHHAPNMGLLYLFELPFLFIGIYFLIFGKFDKRTKILIFSWFLIAPLPASITSGVPHAVRTLNFLPIFQIFVAVGILASIGLGQAIKYKIFNIKVMKLFAICYLLFAIFNFIYYLDQYFVQQNYFNANQWQYGYADVVPSVEKLSSKYKKIVVSNQPPMDQSYMFFLFYLKYPPELYQKQSPLASGGFKENHIFGKYEFRPIDWSREENKSDVLYVGRSIDFPVNVSLIKEAFYPDGQSAMKAVVSY